MSEYEHIVEGGTGGPTIHSKRLLKRSHESFDLGQMSTATAKSFCRVCGMPVDAAGTIEAPTAEDYRHVFESSLGKKLMSQIFERGSNNK